MLAVVVPAARRQHQVLQRVLSTLVRRALTIRSVLLPLTVKFHLVPQGLSMTKESKGVNLSRRRAPPSPALTEPLKLPPSNVLLSVEQWALL